MFEKILDKYNIGDIKSVTLFGNGRVNNSYLVDADNKYVLQKINTDVFKDVDGLMQNTRFVTEHILNKINQQKDMKSKTLKIIKTQDGRDYIENEDGCFRLSEYINNSRCIDTTKDLDIIKEAGRMYGKFQYDLSDFDANKLKITIPNFHNTLDRFAKFAEVYNNCKNKERIEKSEELTREISNNTFYMSLFEKAKQCGLLPKRVVHNDTKLNNIVFDKDEKFGIAVLDLDTVMPDSLVYDFGDAVRSLCNTTSEDDEVIENVGIDLKNFEAFTQGYLGVMQSELNEEENALLPLSPMLMAYELSTRFLTDYLDGDKYFKIQNEDDNLHRAEVQFKLFKSMDANKDNLISIYDDCRMKNFENDNEKKQN